MASSEPGAAPVYKPGVAALYTQLGIPCVALVHNSGLFWADWFLRRPGTIVVEYLEAIPPGLPKRKFMSVLESRMEEAITRLLREPPVQINLSRVKASEP